MSHSKSSNLHQVRKAIAEHFCCDNTQSILIKLEKLTQISVLISVLVKPSQRWEVCDKSEIWLRLKTFWMTLIYTRIFIAMSINSKRIYKTVLFSQNFVNSEYNAVSIFYCPSQLGNAWAYFRWAIWWKVSNTILRF